MGLVAVLPLISMTPWRFSPDNGNVRSWYSFNAFLNRSRLLSFNAFAVAFIASRSLPACGAALFSSNKGGTSSG